MEFKDSWKSLDYKEKQVIECHKEDIRCLAPYISGGVVTGSRDFTSKLFQHEDVNDSTSPIVESQTFISARNYVSSVCVGRNGKGEIKIYVGCHDGMVHIFTMMESSPIKTIPMHGGAVSAIAFRVLNDHECLASGSWDCSIKIIKNDESPIMLGNHAGTIWDIAFVGRSFILTAGADQSINKWNPYTGVMEYMFCGHTQPVRALAVVDGTQFLSCANDCKIILWNLNDGTIKQTFEGHDNFIYDICILREPLFIAKGEERPKHRQWQFVTVSEDKTIRRWNCESGECQQIKLDVATIWSVTSLENGDFAVGASDGKLRLYSCRSTNKDDTE